VKISQVKIENFRGFVSESISIGDYTSLVGPNGAGKSTVLTALRIFFRDTADTTTDLQTLTLEDFNNKDLSKDIVITVTFEGLNEEAQKDLVHYYRHGKLVVSAVARWDPATAKAEVQQYGERLGIDEFRPFFESDNVQEAQAVYQNLRSRFDTLPEAKTKPKMTQALADFEESHPEQLVAIRSHDQFYGFTKGESLLKKYIQWVFVPAVKDASSENMEAKKNAFGALLERTVRSQVNFEDALQEIRHQAEASYTALLDQKQGVLQSLSNSLTQRMATLAHAGASIKIQWDQEASKYVEIIGPLARALGKEGDFEGNLSRFGHGFQRSYLIALLRELSGSPEIGDPKLILACEEPEIHQHPPQARYLASLLKKLSENMQVIVCSHSPHFVCGVNFEDVRLLRYDRTTGKATARDVPLQAVSEEIATALNESPLPSTAQGMKIDQTLQERLKEIFFSPSVVLVEGLEDIGFLESYFALMGVRELLHSLGCHVVPTFGKDNMLRPIAIAKLLEIPIFVVFDADGGDQANRKQNERYNSAIMRLLGLHDANPFPGDILRKTNFWCWPTKIGEEIKANIGADFWDKAASDHAGEKGLGTSDLRKNHIFIGQVLSKLWESHKKSQNLEDLCASIVNFATRGKVQGAALGAPPNSAK